MKTSTFKMIAVFAAVCLIGSVAAAKNGGGNNGGNHNNSNSGNKFSSFKFSQGANRVSNLNNNFNSNSNSFKSKSGLGVSIFQNSNHNNTSIAKKDIKVGQAFHKESVKVGSGIHVTLGGNSFKDKDCHDSCYKGRCYPYRDCYRGYCYNSYRYYPCYGQLTTVACYDVCRACEPFHCNYVILPGDSLYIVSLREYGTSSYARFIAQFNGMPESAVLIPGQMLQMPSIGADGSLSPSHAPNSAALLRNANAIAVGGFNPMPGNMGPVANNFGPMPGNLNPMTNDINPAIGTPNGISMAAPAAVEAPRPKVTLGSTLMINGQSFGDTSGAAQLRIGGAALKIEVVEWTGNSVKIRLPLLDMTGSTNADIEVLRADGSLASKTPVEIGTPNNVALAR